MHQRQDVFQQAITQFQAKTGLQLNVSWPAQSVMLMVDDISISISDMAGKQMMLEAEIMRLGEGRNHQLETALKANLGLIFDCSAAIQRAKAEDGEYLVARAILPYPVTTSGKLISTIEDIASLVDFLRDAASQVDRPEDDKPNRHLMFDLTV